MLLSDVTFKAPLYCVVDPLNVDWVSGEYTRVRTGLGQAKNFDVFGDWVGDCYKNSFRHSTVKVLVKVPKPDENRFTLMKERSGSERQRA